MMCPKPPKPVRDKAHLAFVRKLGCIICGRPAEAAHIRYGDIASGKPHTPAQRRPGDNYALPLCPEHHRTGPDAQHNGNERDWWKRRGIDPIDRARALYAATGDHEQGLRVVRGLERTG